MEMGGAAAIEKRHAGRQLSARERIDYLFDPGTFTEIGLFVKHRTTAFGLDKREIPADGIITGFGKVNGRYVVTMAEDYTSLAGTFGEQHGRKLSNALNLARPGNQEVFSSHRGDWFRRFPQPLSNRAIKQSLVLKPASRL